MLSWNGTTQPLHQAFGLVITEKPQPDRICSFCRSFVFNQGLHTELPKAAKEKRNLNRGYCRIARELHTSILGQCVWCITLGNAVLMAVKIKTGLDAMYGSRSDSATDSVEEVSVHSSRSEVDESGDENSTKDSKIPEDTSMTQSKQNQHVFTPELLNCSANLQIVISFQSVMEAEFFDYLGVSIQVTKSANDEGQLPTLKDDKAVFVELEIFSQRGTRKKTT
jgi:hypothetical protein